MAKAATRCLTDDQWKSELDYKRIPSWPSDTRIGQIEICTDSHFFLNYSILTFN
jgi:hypothetical protein